MISGPQPPFFLGLYVLTVAASFVYLLLAVWFSIYASITAHSFGVRLRTRYVRLPIPNLKQIQSLTTTLSDFEKQGISKVMRVPFGPQNAQDWQLQAQRNPGGASSSSSNQPPSSQLALPGPAPPVSSERGHTALPETHLVEGAADVGFGREDRFMKAAASVPGKHIELFRKLQAKWQCYDAYARIAMALGVNQMIHSVNYFVVGFTMIQVCSPTCGWCTTIVFQACCFGLMFLDIAGLRTWQIFCIQAFGALPIVITVIMLTIADWERGEKEPIDLISTAFHAAPATFWAEAIWLELFMWVATPTRDEANLPARFRTVLFLDVFGDASYDPTEAEHAVATSDGRLEEKEKDLGLRELQQMHAARAELTLLRAQSALRRWEAVPSNVLREQAAKVEQLRQEYSLWRQNFHKCNAKLKKRRGVPYDDKAQDAKILRPWEALSQQEKHDDVFHEHLVGPLLRVRNDSTGGDRFYDLDVASEGRIVWGVDPSRSSLSLEDAEELTKECENAVRSLLATVGDPAVKTEINQDGLMNALRKNKKKGKGHLRLPWKSIRRMTGVLQLCWFFLGLQSLLASLKVWPSSLTDPEARRLSDGDLRMWPEQFQRVPVRWPHGAFFRPSSLSCPQALLEARSSLGRESVLLSSPFLQYSAEQRPAEPLELSPLASQSFPAGAVALQCLDVSDEQGVHRPCFMARLQEGGRELALWQMSNNFSSEELVLQIEGQPWLKVAGAALRCSETDHLQMLSSGSGQDSGWCLVLAGWDGQRVPVAALHLPKSFANLSFAAGLASLSPRVDAPLTLRQEHNGSWSCTADQQEVLALHVSPHASGTRLWALRPAGHAQAWELSTLSSAGHWVLNSEVGFEASAICETPGGSLLLAGVDAAQSPQLLRSALPGEL
eukprot:TRINITY_DN91972_c0_g1_i1.p1 TRINITY_DN91972_c0_g1~~TRINITY_DN91972_c0_g1_i1.p1  ORF type:complete len:1019 (-),score=186.22 TRINITY_DN91972_c0_g1_i1:51-2735(-)